MSEKPTQRAPTPTRCAKCNTVAAESICHLCKEPRAAYVEAMKRQGRYVTVASCAFAFGVFGTAALKDLKPRSNVPPVKAEFKQCVPSNPERLIGAIAPVVVFAGILIDMLSRGV